MLTQLKRSLASSEDEKAEFASSPACMGSVWRGAAQGVRTPFASPNGEQRGGLGIEDENVGITAGLQVAHFALQPKCLRCACGVKPP